MHQTEWNYFAGISAANQNNYLSYEEITEAEDEESPFVDMSQYSGPTPEDLVIRHERWMGLHEETKQLIMLLVDMPDEIREQISCGRKHITAKLVARWLMKTWQEKAIVYTMMKECRAFIKGD